MNKLWAIAPKIPSSRFAKFPQYHPLLLQLLYNRGIKTKKAIEDFLSIDYAKDVNDPYLLSDMKKAVFRIKKAIEIKEKIAIFGDYDADGICAATIINDVLKKIGIVPIVYIPERKKGYGMNNEAIQELANNGVSLIITVDCGVGDYQEIVLANKLGIDVIITDHHLFSAKTPPAYVILNPKKKNETYPNKDLSATGVAYKLATALIKEYQDHFKEGEEKWLLDLVSIATVADMMPLLNENRTLVKYGFLVLAKTRRLGIKTLLKEAGVKDIKVKWIDKAQSRFLIENIDAYTIGFVIGPRLNAAGRMDHANTAFYLLNTSSRQEALKLAKELNRKNQARQTLQKKIIEQIKKTLDSAEIEEKKVIIKGGKDYPKGIVGLISGKLTDEFYVPSFIYKKEKNTSRGSCRGIPEVNIVDILKQCSSCLEDYGGHKAAGGFLVKNSNIKKLTECLEKSVKEIIGDKKLLPKLNIDAKLDFQDISYGLKKTLEELAPFGQGNREPIFMIENALTVEKKAIGKKGQHLSLRLKKIENGKDCYLRALLFENTKTSKEIEVLKHYDFAFVPLFDEWQGKKRVTLKILDWKLSKN